MAEDQKADTTQETPVEETPSAEVASEEQVTVTETPAQSDSETVTTETADGKTPEQLKQDAAYHQTEAQQAKFDAKQAQAELAALGSNDLLGVQTPTTAQPDGTSVDTRQVDRIANMSDDDFNQFVTDNPGLVMQAQQQKIVAMLDERDQRMEVRQTAMAEKDQANKTLHRWMSENDISMDELTTAKKELETFGIKAPPAGIASMLINQVNNNRMQGGIREQSVQAAADAAQAVKAQALTVQPAGSTIEMESKPKTQAERIAEKFGKTRAETATDRFFKAN